MTYSYNGWSASPSPSAIGIRTFTVPGTRRTVPLRDSAGAVLVYMAGWWDDNIEDIEQGIMDEWGYAYRYTRGARSLSCHASGTAMDINATHYPRGTARMTLVKKTKVRYLVRKVNNAAGKRLVNWGGEWSGSSCDQMHIELAAGTNAMDVRRAMIKLTVVPIIDVSRTVHAFKSDSKVGRASAPKSLARIQSRLVALGWITSPYITGYAGHVTRTALMGWQKKHGYVPDGVPGKTQLQVLAETYYRVVN